MFASKFVSHCIQAQSYDCDIVGVKNRFSKLTDVIVFQDAEEKHKEECERSEQEKQELTAKIEEMMTQESILSAKVSTHTLVGQSTAAASHSAVCHPLTLLLIVGSNP